MRHLIAIAVALVLAPAVARAETLTISAGLSAAVPDKWTWEAADYGYEMHSPDGAVTIFLFHMDGEDSFDATWQDLKNQIGAPLESLTIGDHTKQTLGGMPAEAAKATGKTETTEKSVGLVMIALQTPAKQYAGLVIQLVVGKGKKHEGEVAKLLDSVAGVTPDAKDPFWWGPSSVHDFVHALTAAIDGNDAAAVYKMMATKVELGLKIVKKSAIKKAMEKAAAEGGLAAYLGLDPSGAWAWRNGFMYGKQMHLDRGDRTHVDIDMVKGKWVMTGASEDSPD
jgi:hypothetical protein